MAHTQEGLETLLPGICFTVVLSGNDILKELPTSNPGVQKNVGGYRACARPSQGCMGCRWSPRGAGAELHHRPTAQGSWGRAPSPTHGPGELQQSSGTSAPSWVHPCDWPLRLPFHQQRAGRCRHAGHELPTQLYKALYLLSLGRTALLWPAPGCPGGSSHPASLRRTPILCHPTLTPAARSLPGPAPTTQSMGFCQIGQRSITQVSKEKGRILSTLVLFIPLFVKHPCACITGEASKPKRDTYRSKTR